MALLLSASAIDADQLPAANVPAPGAAVTHPCPVGVEGIAVTGVDDPPCDHTSAKWLPPDHVLVFDVSVPPVLVDIVHAVVMVPLATDEP